MIMGSVNYMVFHCELDVWCVISYISIVSLTYRTVPFTIILVPISLDAIVIETYDHGKRPLYGLPL